MTAKKCFSLLLAACLCVPPAGCSQKPQPESAETTVETTAVGETQPEIIPQITLPPETQPPTVPLWLSEPEEDAFVPVVEFVPGVLVELKYATEENFTGCEIYDFREPYLRYGTVKKLIKVQEELQSQGLGILLWDGFRPVAAQFDLWEICPDPTYVADPRTGYSSHSRGNTVDLTLVNSAGEPLEMPTDFDDFSALADRDYSDCTQEAKNNALLLQQTMENHGFKGYFGEWWHFTDMDSYPVEETFRPADPSWWYADCEEFISLRLWPDTGAEVITRIPVREKFRLLGWYDDFALVNYNGALGYVLAAYAAPAD